VVAACLRVQICPYYGSRRAVPGADVVLAPYSAVLMPDARESLGIELQDSVLVFDEAHNLLDAINSAHSTTVTGERCSGHSEKSALLSAAVARQSQL
jgi:chromosome transmission fidelity protein 1